jgi:hypothetical protein
VYRLLISVRLDAIAESMGYSSSDVAAPGKHGLRFVCSVLKAWVMICLDTAATESVGDSSSVQDNASRHHRLIKRVALATTAIGDRTAGRYRSVQYGRSTRIRTLPKIRMKILMKILIRPVTTTVGGSCVIVNNSSPPSVQGPYKFTRAVWSGPSRQRYAAAGSRQFGR